MHFEATVAASGIIAPKLYIHLRKAQNVQHSEKAILLTEMSYGYIDDQSTAYESLGRDDLELGSEYSKPRQNSRSSKSDTYSEVI